VRLERINPTDQLSRRVAGWMVGWRWMHRDRKALASVLSVFCFWSSSACAGLLVVHDMTFYAGLIVGIGWQLGCIFDCLDGALARSLGKGSPGGVGVDATADLLSMTGVATVCLFSASSAEAPAGTLALLGLGLLGRASGPVWTTASALVGLAASLEPATTQAGHGATKTLGAMQCALLVIRVLADYPLAMLVSAIAVGAGSSAGWTTAAIALAIPALCTSVLAFAAMLRADGFR